MSLGFKGLCRVKKHISKNDFIHLLTEPVPPASVTVSSISSESVSLQWDTPAGEVESYNVTCCSEGETVQELNTDTNSVTFNNLMPGVCYSFYVCAQLRNGRRSRTTEASAKTSKSNVNINIFK